MLSFAFARQAVHTSSPLSGAMPARGFKQPFASQNDDEDELGRRRMNLLAVEDDRGAWVTVVVLALGSVAGL
jgi:hypothetical protein